jgi:hypothetical protein
MRHALFYTSAPKGLQPGSRGFCAVASTEGLPGHLAEKVESLSAYRPLYPPLDPRAHLNPVVHSHLRVTVGGKTYSVLSRISPSGLDYSQRSNKFAHHVILEPGELPPGGPAWLLAQPGFLESSWDGEVRFLPTGRIPPKGDFTPGVCRHWQSLTGDSGWAGVLAESFEKNPPRQVYLIFEPGMDLLPLVAEAISLVPPSKRWLVTCSTYFTGLPQGIPCLWRFVLKDSPEAAQAGRLHGQEMINLTESLGRPPASELVERARTGRKPANAAALMERLEPANDWPARSGRTFHTKEPVSARYDVSDIDPPRPASTKGSPQPRIIRPPPPQTAKHKRSWIWAALIVGVILGVVAGIAASLLVLNRNWKEAVANKNASDEQENLAVVAKEKGAGEKDQAKKEPKDKGAAEASEKTKEPKDLEKVLEEKDQAIRRLTEKVKSLQKSNDSLDKENRSLEKQLNEKTKFASKARATVTFHFRLPPWSVSALNDKETKVERDVAKEWGIDPSKSCKLALMGCPPILEPQQGETPSSLLVMRKGDKEAFASFTVDQGKLRFNWSPHEGEELKRAQHLLRECILEISQLGKKTYIALRKPTTISDKERDFNFNQKGQYDFLKDEVQGRPSKDFYFDAVEIKIGDTQFSGLSSAGQLPRASFVPIYKEIDREWMRYGLIEKLQSKNDKKENEKYRDFLLTFSLPNMPQKEIPKIRILSLVAYIEIDGQYVEVARIDKPK